MIAPDVLHTMSTALLQSILEALGVMGRPMPNRLYVASGTPDLVAWDDCCVGSLPPDAEPDALPPEGQLTASLVRLFRTRTFPAEDLTVRGNCDETRLVMTLAVELVRCSSVVDEDDDGTPPSADVLDAEGRTSMIDALAIARGISCQVEQWVDEDRGAVFGGVEPIGPAGTCVGHRAIVHVEAVTACLCQPVPEP